MLVIEVRRDNAFALFFVLASLDAAFAAGLWPVLALGRAPVAIDSFAAWHARELIYGFLSATLGGFLLAALPRWTGRPDGPLASAILLALWIAARVLDLTNGSARTLVAAFPVALAAWACWRIGAARRWRDASVAALLVLYALGALAACASFAPPDWRQLGLRVSLTAAAALVIEIGGRIIPALTERLRDCESRTNQPARKGVLGALAQAIAMVSLALWAFDMDGVAVAAVASAAAALQFVRLLSWRGEYALRAPAVMILHVAYLFAPIGFALQAARALSTTMPDAAQHAFAVGLCGLMSLGVMSSVARKRAGHSFRTSPLWRVSASIATLAVLCRAFAEFTGYREQMLALAALMWAGAFLVFAYEIRTMSLQRA